MTSAVVELLCFAIAAWLVIAGVRWIGNNYSRLRREADERITGRKHEIHVWGKE